MPKRLVVANWKMHPATIEEARKIASQIEHGILGTNRSKVDVAIAVPFVFLPVVRHAVHFIKPAAQDLAAYEQGAFTGEVSAKQLREFNVSYAIIGHSERRTLGEEDEFINKKILTALANKIEPILCVGYGTTKGMSESAEKKILSRQLRRGLWDVDVKKENFNILYEPVWAISKGVGSGLAVAPSHAVKMIKFIKTKFPKARVLYGGSIDAKTAAGFAAEESIQGGVVGAASLRPTDFLEIIRAFGNFHS